MTFKEIINKHFSYSNVEFKFLSGPEEETFILVRDKDIYSLFDIEMNLILQDIKLDKSHNAYEVIRNKKGEYSLNKLKERDKKYNCLNYCCGLTYFTYTYNGMFLGVITPNENKASISASVGEERFIPAVLFNSHGPNFQITPYQNLRGTIKPWIGDGDEHVLGEDVKNYPWVIFFNGNDDASYYCRFKTYYDAITAWEIMKEEGCMPEEVDHLRKEHLRYAFLRQSNDKLFYFYNN